MMVPSGGKTVQVGVVLTFLADKLVIKGEGIERELLYSEITSAMYSRSKHPRWKAYDRVGTGTSLQSRRARVQGLPNEEGECNGD